MLASIGCFFTQRLLGFGYHDCLNPVVWGIKDGEAPFRFCLAERGFLHFNYDLARNEREHRQKGARAHLISRRCPLCARERFWQNEANLVLKAVGGLTPTA